MKFIQLSLFFVFMNLSANLTAQEYAKEFGRVSSEDLNLTQYAGDKSAEAVVLFDVGKSYFVRFEGSFMTIFERTTRIKIFSNAATEWAEIEIPFYQEGGICEIVTEIEANAYNLNNGVIIKTSLDVNNCYDEKVNESWNVKKFAIPKVKEGSVIEYKYKIQSQYIFNLRDWEFQWKIPVKYSEYEVRMIPFYEYTYLLQGATRFDSQTSNVDRGISRQFGSIEFQDMVHKYIMKDLPAFYDEEYISSINDYLIKIDFQLAKINYPDGRTSEIITTWPDLIESLLKNPDFGKYLNKCEKLSSGLMIQENLSSLTEEERFNTILNYVKENYSWNEYNSKYTSKSANGFINDKFGNSADINLFTIGLLNAYNIKSYPVIISTRKNGKVRDDYPFSHFFNYVLILADVNGKKILTDATDIFISNDRIPDRCINDKGLIINKEKVEWIGLECYFPSELKTTIEIKIDNTDLLANLNTSTTEYDAYHFRTKYGDDKELITKEITEEGYNITDTVTVKNQLDIKNPYILNYNIKNKAEIIDEKIYIDPFLNETPVDNPFTQQERTYPIDFTYPITRTFYSTINIPEGYEVDYLPSAYEVDNSVFSMDYKIAKNDRKIQVSFIYSFKKPVYQSTNYSKIKFYYGMVVKKGNEKVVLSKSNNN